jgi:hypothetical protein
VRKRRQAEPELRQKYGDDSAVQILDEVFYPIAEKLIEKDALSPEQATANMPAVEATQTKTDEERLESNPRYAHRGNGKRRRA